MKRLLLPLFFLAVTPLFAAEPERLPPLARPLRLSLWGASLAQTAKAIQDQTGVEILFYLPDLPSETTNTPSIHIVTGNVTLGTIMEALARAYSFRFRATAAGKIELSRGYNWVGVAQTLRFVRMPPMVSKEDGEQAFRKLLAEMVKPLPLLEGEFALKFEAYPLPRSPDNRRGTLVLPGALADYVERGLRCLAGGAGDFPSPAEGPRAALFARARDCEADWEGLLSRRIRAPGGKDLRSIVEEAALGAGVAVVIRPPEEGAGAPLPQDMEWYTLGRFCDILASRWGLGKRVFLSCGAVVFEPGTEAAVETDSRSRELFWDGLAVAGFDVGKAVERTRGAAALTTLLRRDVFPGLWRDPVCSMTYSPVHGRLAVVAPINVMAPLAQRIKELERY